MSVRRQQPPALTGPFDTAQLPRLAPVPVTVTVARRIAPGSESEFLRWSEELVSVAREFPGFLGAAVLHPGDSDGEYQTVVRFADGVMLRNWERSPERAELMARSEPFVVSSRVQRTVGVQEWFDAAAFAQPKRPWWKKAFYDVAWVFPAAMVTSVFVAPYLGDFWLPLRVLGGAAVITLVLQIIVAPVRASLRRRRRL